MKKLNYVASVMIVLGACTSLFIPFIYTNIEFLVFIFGYFFLCILHIHFIFLQTTKNFLNNVKDYLPFKDIPTIKERMKFLLSVLIMPLLTGWLLSLSTPIVAEIFASDFEIREYKVTKLSNTSFRRRAIRARVFVSDIKSEPASFLIGRSIINQLDLKVGEKIIVSGRRFPAGFVIDRINDMEL